MHRKTSKNGSQVVCLYEETCERISFTRRAAAFSGELQLGLLNSESIYVGNAAPFICGGQPSAAGVLDPPFLIPHGSQLPLFELLLSYYHVSLY